MLLTASALQGRDFEQVRRDLSVPFDQCAAADGPGISGADDRRRGAGEDVSAHGEATGRWSTASATCWRRRWGRRAIRCWPIGATWRRPPEAIGSLEQAGTAELGAARRGLGRRLRRRPWRADRPRSAVSYGFLLDEGLRHRRSVAALAAAEPPAAAAQGPRYERSRGDVRGGRGAGGERRAAGASQPRPARTALRLGPARDRAGVAAAPRGAGRASRS